jgi:hypothetical protein
MTKSNGILHNSKLYVAKVAKLTCRPGRTIGLILQKTFPAIHTNEKQSSKT